MTQPRIAVVGSGIGGLVFCAAFGQRSSSELDLYESASKLGEIGAGIGMWYRTWKVMELLGLDKDLAETVKQSPKNEPCLSFRYRKSDEEKGDNYFDMITTGGLSTMARAGVQQVLIQHLPPTCRTHFQKKLISYDDSLGGPIILHFEDGSTAECDVLIGADGIKSAVRPTFLTALEKAGTISQSEALASKQPVWTGTIAYRGIVPRNILDAVSPGHRALTDRLLYVGKNKHLIVFPIAQGTLINVVAFVSELEAEGTPAKEPWVADVTKEYLLAQYAGWENEVLTLLNCIEKPSRWAIHSLHPLNVFASGRVALMGDAAHAMTPHLGSGAGQAIEDACILSALLASPKCTTETVPRIMQIYDQIRRPFANRVLELSRSVGLLFELNGPGHDVVKPHSVVPREVLEEMGESCRAQWEWAWSTSLDADLEKAVAML